MTSRTDIRNFEYTMILVALFVLYMIYNDDPSGFGPFFVGAIAYFSCLILSIVGFGYAKKRERITYILLLAVATASVLTSAYLLTGGNGSPTQGSLVSTSCTNIQIPNATSPTGFTYGSTCTSNPYYDKTSVLYNLVFWAPLVGSIIYAMPSWLDTKRNLTSSISRNVRGSVPAGALLFLTFGLVNSSGYPELFNGHSPFNPFVAYNYCDSTTFGVVSCVQTNALIYFVDLAFWIVVASLISLVASELHDSTKSTLRKKREHTSTPIPTIQEATN